MLVFGKLVIFVLDEELEIFDVDEDWDGSDWEDDVEEGVFWVVFFVDLFIVFVSFLFFILVSCLFLIFICFFFLLNVRRLVIGSLDLVRKDVFVLVVLIFSILFLRSI